MSMGLKSQFQSFETGDPVFRARFEDSRVIDEDGAPLLVFRGEHGARDDNFVQCRVAAISFGTLEAAVTYATKPNSYSDNPPKEPRVLPAFLSLRRPFINDPDDPFVDLGMVQKVLGYEEALRVGRKFADAIENTNNWEDISEELRTVKTPNPTVLGWLRKRPDVSRLYFDAYDYFDDEKEMSKLRALGFDGAIHAGTSETFSQREYKVFDPAQILPASPRWLTPDEAREFAVEWEARRASAMTCP
ncbi:hypothetical protein [Bradyrhizobium sp. USDA 4350]